MYKSYSEFSEIIVIVDHLQIQLVDDGADTTSPETPEAATSKMFKRGRHTAS